MLANLENSMLLWTNERSAKEDQTLHMHIFRKEIGPEAYRNKLPVEEAALTPITRNRKGEGVIFRLEDYPSRRDPIEVIALKGSVANEGDRGLLAARCFSAETIIRRNGYPVDKVFMKRADDNVVIYMFPRKSGYEVFFRFRKGQKKRPVGPLAMMGLWILDNEAEYTEFTPRLAQNILANTAVRADSEEAISIEQNIKRDFEESEGIGILPGTFSMKPFEIMDQTGIKKYGRELIVRQRQIVERLWDGGVRRLNVDLGNWHGSLGDRHRWNAAHHILVCARRKGMTTVISIDQLPSNIDVLIPYRRYIDRSIMPHVDKISFRSDAAGEGFVRAVEFFDRFFPEKELEIFTYVDKTNEEAVDSIGKVLAWRGKRSKHLTQWALVRDTSSEEGKSLSEERYDLITEGIERKFPGVNIRHYEKSPEAAEIFVNDKGVIRAPGVAPEGWTADIFDIEKLNSEQSRQVFKATTERLRMESIPAGVMDEYKDTKGPGLGTAVTLLPAVKRLCAAEIHARTEAEALIASKIIEKMGLSAPAAEVGVLAVWAYNIGLGPRSSNNQFFESVKSFLENKYPEAKSPNGKWDLETAVEMLIDGVVPKDAPLIDRFEAFAAEYARQTGRETLNHAQRLVALSVFASKQLSYDILGNRRIRLPHDAKTLVDHYGRYRKMQRYLNRIGAHKEWRPEYSSERLSPDEILKITAAIRVAGRFSSYTDNASQALRGETPMSLSDSIETILNEFKANSENDEVTNGAVTSLVMLLADGDRDIMDTIERLSEGSQGEAKRAFLSFLRGSYERISMISSEEGPQKIIDDFSGYELGPSVSEYISAARFSFILAGGMFIVALASLSGIPASKAYLAGFAAAFLAGSYLIISGHNFLRTGHTIEKAIIKVRDGDPIFMKRIQEGKIRSYPFIKVFPDGTIDWKNDGFTRALMAELPDRVKKHIESIESYDTTREAILNDIPLRKWFRNRNRDLEIRQQKKAKKYMASMKKVVTYSSLDQGRMDRRKGEMDLSGGRWEWKYGDGVGVVALAGNSLRREVAAIQRELRDVVRSRMRQIAGRDPSEEEMNRVLQLTDPDTVHMTVSEDIPNTRQIDPSRADERVSMMRKISGILSDSKINVMFNVSDVSILEDGSILIFGREVDDSLETLRGAIAKETQGDETRRKRIQHITIGRIFDKEKLGQEAYYHMREILRMRSKRGVVEVPMDPSLRVWDQAGAFGTSGGGRYVEPREILDIFSERQEPSRDLSGTMAPESDQLIKSLIKDGRIAEVFLVKGQLAVRRIKYVEGHVPGRASAEDYLGEDLDPADIFTKEQAENIEGWMKGKTLPDERGDVRFRIILGGAAIGWNTDAEHISVSHAGYRDGVIYIGGRLLASIFTESHDPVRMLILDQDEYRHLTEKDFDCRLDTEAYKSRLSEAINRIKAINDTNPDRPRTDICPDAATARERHYGVDKEDPNIKWGNFTPQDKDLIRDDMSPVNVAASLFILDGTDVPEDRLRMKIWMGPDDNYFRWSEKKMQLVYRNIVEGGTVYYFEGELPAFFHGDFTFKYSVDGGTRWRWANRGPGDDLKLRRTMFDESKAKIGAYGLWRGDGQRADYKRAKIFTLYKGNVNLKALVDKARDVDDVFWETWKVPSGEAGKNKVIFAGHSTDDEGNNEGSVLVMYNDMSRTISVIMRGDYEDAIIPGTDRKLSSTDWYRSVVEIRLDERFRAKEVFHRPELMGISRSGMALLMLHAGIDREEYAGLFRLLQEELVLYPVSPKMKLEDTYDMKPIEVGAIVKIMDDPDGALDISLDEIDSLERIIEFARSKTLTRLALACLEILAEQGRYRKDLYREKERYVTEKMVLEGMASVERVIRQDKTILREMGIDRAAVKSVAVRWFAGGVNKMIYRVTFRMHDKAAKVFAMEFMSPVRLGEDFMMTNVEKPINIWERKLSDAGFDFVPHVFSVKRISDYKPKILEEPLPRMAERTSNWDFAMDPAVMDPARALYDDTLIVAREYVEGQEALEYAASVSPNAEEEKRINLAALTAYLRMWKATKDPVTGRGAGLMEPDKSNVVVYVQSSGYHGMVADFHSLSYGLGLKDLIRMLHHNKFTKEECAEAARGVLNDEECALAGKVLEEIDEAHPDDMITEERPFMLAVSDVPDETLQEVSRGILEYPERSGLKLNAEQQRLSMHGIKGALSYLAERINRNMDISPGIKDNLAITVDQMRRREIWTKVQYYKARWGHDLILGGRMPVYDMLYAFKHEDAFHLAEGFLDGTGVSREECVALVILRHIVAEMFPEKDRDELRDIVGKVIGEESTLHIDGLIKRYAARSYIKILLEDDVLGIGPEKDLITYQAL
ncbi:MAG: hypothetical protein PHT95_02380, partial [Candidatus Omnitrophica bacterium]|nr:hypothetical protein [Candidatus Omnitrophota bacterium]